MDYSGASYSGLYSETARNTDCRMAFPAFVAPTPINMGKTSYTGNTLTPGL